MAPRATTGRSDQVLATHYERRRVQRPGTTIKFLRGAAGIGLGAKIKYLRAAAGIGLSTATKYQLRRSFQQES